MAGQGAREQQRLQQPRQNPAYLGPRPRAAADDAPGRWSGAARGPAPRRARPRHRVWPRGRRCGRPQGTCRRGEQRHIAYGEPVRDAVRWQGRTPGWRPARRACGGGGYRGGSARPQAVGTENTERVTTPVRIVEPIKGKLTPSIGVSQGEPGGTPDSFKVATGPQPACRRIHATAGRAVRPSTGSTPRDTVRRTRRRGAHRTPRRPSWKGRHDARSPQLRAGQVWMRLLGPSWSSAVSSLNQWSLAAR